MLKKNFSVCWWKYQHTIPYIFNKILFHQHTISPTSFSNIRIAQKSHQHNFVTNITVSKHPKFANDHRSRNKLFISNNGFSFPAVSSFEIDWTAETTFFTWINIRCWIKKSVVEEKKTNSKMKKCHRPSS